MVEKILGRMSARSFAKEWKSYITAKEIYEIWKDMGLVVKDKYGDWIPTALGRSFGGQMSSKSNYPVPTFVFEDLCPMMEDFLNKKTN